MARPLKGTLKQLPSGKWQASLPVARGDSRRRTPSFDNEPAAQGWLDAGLAALGAGQPLPDPAAFRVANSVARPGARRTRPSFPEICWKWHASTTSNCVRPSPDAWSRPPTTSATT